MPASLCICICTYQRPILLQRCLESLKQYAAEWPVLVVDNAGEAACQKICQKYGVQYIHAPEVGLSHARNVGYRSSKHLNSLGNNIEWICYLDDDAKVRADTIQNIALYLEDTTLSGIGGRFEHYYDQTPPNWLKIANGKGLAPVKNVDGPCRLQSGQKLFGGIMALRLTAIQEVGGFNPSLGMQGKAFGYGEETELIQRLLHKGHQLVYDPSIVIDHLYSMRKYSLRAHLQMSYQQGVADRRKGLNGPTTLITLLALWLKLIFFTLPFTVLRWAFRHPEWKWQNVFLIVACKFTDSWGYYTGHSEIAS